MSPRLIRLQGAAFVKCTPKTDNFIENCKDSRLRNEVANVRADLLKNRELGEKIPRKQWPKFYISQLGINNAYRCDLGDGWRMIYTLLAEMGSVGVLILEVLSHKGYAKRFGYRVS